MSNPFATTPTDFERRVRNAVDPLHAFQQQLVDELDEVDGAFKYWHGGSDWKTYAVLADYLIQSVLGTVGALHAAAASAIDHREALFAANAKSKAEFQKLRTRKIDRDTFAFAVTGSADARRRTLRIESSAEHAFFHMGQALDRFSAALIIVGGFSVKDVATVDWKSIEDVWCAIDTKSTKNIVEPLGSRGREIQERLLAPVGQVDDFGGADWLAWLRDTRNALTHRSPAKHLTLLLKDGGIIHPFYLQPKLSELQTLAYGPIKEARAKRKSSRETWQSSYLIKSTDDVLDGLLDSLCRLIVAFTKTMVVCWDERKTDPSAIIQTGRQWRSVRPDQPDRAFIGYGQDPILMKADTMVLHPNDAKRLRAGRVTDDRVADWNDD